MLEMVRRNERKVTSKLCAVLTGKKRPNLSAAMTVGSGDQSHNQVSVYY